MAATEQSPFTKSLKVEHKNLTCSDEEKQQKKRGKNFFLSTKLFNMHLIKPGKCACPPAHWKCTSARTKSHEITAQENVKLRLNHGLDTHVHCVHRTKRVTWLLVGERERERKGGTDDTCMRARGLALPPLGGALDLVGPEHRAAAPSSPETSVDCRRT